MKTPANSPARSSKTKQNPFGKLTEEKRWVVWNAEEVKGAKGKPSRMTKVPYSLKNRMASSTDPATWATYDEVKKGAEFFTGIGVIFTPEEKLLGIDIDHVIDHDNGKLQGEHADSIKRLIKEANTYTELSPSGTGLHLYLRLNERLTLSSNRHAPFEAYTSGRFFTVTEKSFGSKKAVREVSAKEAEALLAIIGYPWNASATQTPSPSQSQAAALLDPASSLNDEDVLEKMFSSKKNGKAIRALYDGDTSAQGDDLSRADASLLAHLAFWTARAPEQMERLWLASPLGAREKTQQRKDYRVRSINAAVAKCKEVYSSEPMPGTNAAVIKETGIDFLYTLTATGQKNFTKNTENVCRVLREHPALKNTFRLDEFKNSIEVLRKSTWRPMIDTDAIDTQTHISILFPFMRTVSKDMVFDAIIKVAKENAIDSARDYVASLKWDSTPRLDEWLTHTYGTPSDSYHHAVASNWWKGLVKRIVFPGCKFDYVLVLEGPQGSKKSTSLGVIGQQADGSNWHVESTMSPDNKDFFMQFEGKAIIEFSEGETLSRTEVKKMKSVITTASDRYRPSYGRVAQDFPRRCVFAMTTNQDEYLKDETGNRRWLPVRVRLPQANVEWLSTNREQLYAEAYYRVVTQNETVYEFPEKETAEQQDMRRISDPNEDRIADWYATDQFTLNRETEGITTQMVFQGALSGFGQMKKHEEMSIADVLARVLKLQKKRKMINGVQQWRWFPPDAIASPLSSIGREPYVNTSEFDDEDLPFPSSEHE